MLAGQVTVGRILSVTVMVKLQELTSPFTSTTIYVMFETPALKLRVPILLIPVVGDAATVAPEEIQVSCAMPQLSLVIGFGTAIEATQVPAPTLAVMFAGQLIVGTMLSFIVTV
jgi:hypothetical protein